MKPFIRGALARLGMFWLITLVTLFVIFLASAIEYMTYFYMGISMRPAGWLMLVVLPLLVAPPLLFVMLNQFQMFDAEHAALLDTQEQLLAALEEVKGLRGMLPMCASCKKVRDSRDDWLHVDVYLRKHTHAEISHGMCPDCVEETLSYLN